MRMVETHSHFGGLEYLQIHKQELWRNIRALVETIHITSDKKVSSTVFEDCWADQLLDQGWETYDAGFFVKDRVALKLLPQATMRGAYESNLTAYMEDQIDVGIEILPMKSMQSHMSSGVAYYEGELYNVVRNGRGVPAVPLVILGIDA